MTYDIIVFKLVSGEEIIGKLTKTDTTTNTLYITDVRTFTFAPQAGNQMAAVMMPWLITAPDAEIKINMSAIIGTVQDVPKTIEDNYLQQVTGLDLSPQPTIQT